jgi:hypothetical protein
VDLIDGCARWQALRRVVLWVALALAGITRISVETSRSRAQRRGQIGTR